MKWSRSLAMVLILLGVHSATGVAQQSSPPVVSDELMRAIEGVSLATLNLGEAVRPAIDRSAFDQGILLDRLDFDDAEIVRFVTEEIAYQQYAGVLRGARGTLLARAGNAVDQSLLLATLLNDAGFEATIRGGTLTDDDAARLLGMLAARPGQTVTPAPPNVARAQAQLQERFEVLLGVETREGRAPGISMNEITEGIERDRDELLAALRKAGVRLGDDQAGAALLQEAREYFWVDYRTGPSAPWKSVHAAFGTTPPPEVAVTASYAGAIPVERTHRLRIELFVVQRFGSTLKTMPLMAPMEFPSANVAGQSISLMLAPDTLLRSEPLADGSSAEAETRFLIPLINNGLPEGAQALMLNGTTVPPEAISVSASGVFETVSARFEDAASALSGLGSGEEAAVDLVAIESVRLHLTLIHPDSGSRTIERVLYLAPGEAPPVKDASMDADETERRVRLVAELARSHSLGFVTGSLAPAYVADEALAELERVAPLIRAWSDPALDECDSLDCLPRPKFEPSPTGSNVSLAVAFFDRELPLEPGAILYRDAPNVLRVSQPLFPATSPRPGVFDIVSNSRRGFTMKDGRPMPAAELVLSAGVAETHLERLQPGFRGRPSTIQRSFGDRQALPLRAWTGVPPLSGAGAIEREMLERALSGGSVVVTASDPSTNSQLGWWEVDPVSGRALGMTRYGGASLTEYIVGGLVGYAVAMSVVSVIACSTFMESTRIEPGTGRRQRATWLACTYCNAKGFLNLDVYFDLAQLTADSHRYCIGEQDGWEYG